MRTLKDTDDHRHGHGDPPHLRILLHDLFDAALQKRVKPITDSLGGGPPH